MIMPSESKVFGVCCAFLVVAFSCSLSSASPDGEGPRAHISSSTTIMYCIGIHFCVGGRLKGHPWALPLKAFYVGENMTDSTVLSLSFPMVNGESSEREVVIDIIFFFFTFRPFPENPPRAGRKRLPLPTVSQVIG